MPRTATQALKRGVPRLLGLRLRRVDAPEEGQPYSRYTGVYEDRFENTYHAIRWWHPGLWLLIARDRELTGKRWAALKAAYQNRRTFIK